MINTDYNAELVFAENLAREAGKIMRKYFRSPDARTRLKDDKTLVTRADTEINSLLIERSKQAFPGYSIHGEEEHHKVADSEFTWVCDPVDGTEPFSMGLPISTFSLALVDKDGQAVLGVIYDPFEDRLYEAVRGMGAVLNGEPIHVSSRASLDGAYINQEVWINVQKGVSFDEPRGRFAGVGARVSVLCSACISGCLVAEGKFDALIFGSSKPEDIAALSVIVTEAGGRVSDLRGHEQRYDRKIFGAIVSNGRIHDKIVAITTDMNYQSKYVD